MQIVRDEVGTAYYNALIKVVNIRKERRLIYKDSFLDESIAALLSIIDGKRKRFNVLRSRPIDKYNTLKKQIEQLSDIINYTIFILCILEKEK